MTSFFRLARPARSAVLALGLLLPLLALGACRDLTGDQFGKTGAVEVLVQDQAGAPLFDVTVEIARQNEIDTERTANNGVVRFDLVEVGQREVTVRNPVGYTGGGDATAKTVTVVEGEIVKTTFTLTKVP